MYTKDVAATFVAATLIERTEHAVFNPPSVETVTVEDSISLLRELVPDVKVELGAVPPPESMADLPLLDGGHAL